MTRNQTLLASSLVLAVIILIGILLFKFVEGKEQDAVALLNTAYPDESLVIVNSTTGYNPFNDDFTITVRSKQTDHVYNFDVEGEKIEGKYFEENVNLEINQFVETNVDGLAMADADMAILTAPTAAKDAKIEDVELLLMTKEKMTDRAAKQLGEALQQQFNIAKVSIEVLVVKNENDYNGVTTEIKKYFQLSDIDENNFENLKYTKQTFSFGI